MVPYSASSQHTNFYRGKNAPSVTSWTFPVSSGYQFFKYHFSDHRNDVEITTDQQEHALLRAVEVQK